MKNTDVSTDLILKLFERRIGMPELVATVKGHVIMLGLIALDLLSAIE